MRACVNLILAVILSLNSHLLAFTSPIPKPKHTAQQAVELVMKEFAKRAADYPPKWRDDAFPQYMEFTSYGKSSKIKKMFPESQRERIRESDLSWVLEEWGWLVTVVMANDLSQSDTFFLRSSGECILLWESN